MKTYEPTLEETKPQAITGNPKSMRHKPHPISSNPTIVNIAPKFHVSKGNRILC